MQLTVRPSESALKKGYRLINQTSGNESDDEDLEIAVKFRDLGVFDTFALDIWMRAISATSIKLKVIEELAKQQQMVY